MKSALLIPRTNPPAPIVRRRTSADLVLNSIAWADVDNALDITLPARAGDVIRYDLSAEWSNGAVDGSLDVATIVAAAPVNYFAANSGTPIGAGNPAWRGPSGIFSNAGGAVFYTLQTADLVGASVTLRLRYSTFAATPKTLFAATATAVLQVAAQNLGQ